MFQGYLTLITFYMIFCTKGFQAPGTEFCNRLPAVPYFGTSMLNMGLVLNKQKLRCVTIIIIN